MALVVLKICKLKLLGPGPRLFLKSFKPQMPLTASTPATKFQFRLLIYGLFYDILQALNQSDFAHRQYQPPQNAKEPVPSFIKVSKYVFKLSLACVESYWNSTIILYCDMLREHTNYLLQEICVFTVMTKTSVARSQKLEMKQFE